MSSERDKILAKAREWKLKYEEEGETVESLALDNNMHPQMMRQWLHDVGTKMRGPGGKPTYRNKATDGIKGKYEGGGVDKIGPRQSARGHRRRNRYL